MYKELTAAGLSKGAIKYTDLIPFDEHHHYHGVEAVELCASKLNIQINNILYLYNFIYYKLFIIILT